MFIEKENDINNLINNFELKYILKHKSLYNITKLSNRLISDLYPQIIKCIIKKDETSEIKFLVETLTKVYIKFNIPYTVINKEFNYLEKVLLHLILEDKNCNNALYILNIFEELDILINDIFLNDYLNSLIENNELRLKILHNSIYDDMLKFYQTHITWINKLANSILNKDITLLPEMKHKNCKFGIWLYDKENKELLNNREDKNALIVIHKKLHMVAHVIYNLLKENETNSNEYLIYMQKAENLTKDIVIKLSTFSSLIARNNATKDPLTGLLNRELLETLFISEYDLHATTQGTMLLAMCDLDHFKNINDTYGHVAGDKVLKSFASLLMDILRATDIIIRFGGEEFVLILPSAKLYQGIQILNNIRTKLENQIIFYEEHEIKVTVSIGITELKPKLDVDEEEKILILEKSLKQADELLYKAKRKGRNTVEV